jgi:predicted 3-demethylubiquinone-9 3-methyltransferase (glyoxalase superfamily)
MQKIVTYLWFDSKAEEAANFYTSLFEDGKVTGVTRYGEGAPGEPGSIMVVHFQLAGQEFIALNGGPQYRFTEAVSLYVNCETQEEVDRLWTALTDGGQEQPCGWLKDRYGLSWQLIPTALPRLLDDPDPDRARRVIEAMFKMSKIDIATLEAARDGA